MHKLKRICIIVATLLFAFTTPANFSAAQPPEVHATAHILVELESGRVISEYQAHRRMFPAATTRILTAILAYEHIGMDEIIIAGNEVHSLPHGSARNWHEVGEAITGANLLRGMLIGNGNDTANIVAIEVARRATDNPNISFANAQVAFSNLMTQRAAELGALDSRFVNPHGYHHDSHFTTAYDMAQISRHALSIPALAQVLASPGFSGPMAGDGEIPEGTIQLNRGWTSPNELLHEGGEHFYPYAIGLRTGATSQAGESLAGAATRNGITLVSVTFNSPEIELEVDGEVIYAPTRWQDNINLFEFGFANFANRVFLEAGAVVGELPIYDPRIDDDGYLDFFALAQGMMFLSDAEMALLQRSIEFVPDVVTYAEQYDEAQGESLGEILMFVAPIYEGDAIGTISYYLDGEVVFSAIIYASRYVPIRTAVSDIEIRMERIHQIFFTAGAIPYWIAAVSVLTLITVLVILARRSIKRKRSNYKYKWKY